MTQIKCRWKKPYCAYNYGHTRLYHYDDWFCDSSDCCFDGKYTEPENAKVINPQCIYCEYDKGEFEKTVKRYSYEYGQLRVAGETYREIEIEYLEIDGRVLIEPKRGEE